MYQVLDLPSRELFSYRYTSHEYPRRETCLKTDRYLQLPRLVNGISSRKLGPKFVKAKF